MIEEVVEIGDLCEIKNNTPSRRDYWHGYTTCPPYVKFRTLAPIENGSLCIFINSVTEISHYETGTMLQVFSPRYGIIYLSRYYHKLIKYHE